jgi:hypothetical protein
MRILHNPPILQDLAAETDLAVVGTEMAVVEADLAVVGMETAAETDLVVGTETTVVDRL